VKISTQLSYAGGFKEAARDVADMEKAGLDLVWVAEAYGFDGPSLMGYLAALTDKEAELYDRQIRLWGVEAQQRLRGARMMRRGAQASRCGFASSDLLKLPVVFRHPILA
jgi:hypothetical protein